MYIAATNEPRVGAAPKTSRIPEEIRLLGRELVNEGANQVLDENSDDEAYIWLTKTVSNIERADGKIESY